jgi:hypothetical protein
LGLLISSLGALGLKCSHVNITPDDPEDLRTKACEELSLGAETDPGAGTLSWSGAEGDGHSATFQEAEPGYYTVSVDFDPDDADYRSSSDSETIAVYGVDRVRASAHPQTNYPRESPITENKWLIGIDGQDYVILMAYCIPSTPPEGWISWDGGIPGSYHAQTLCARLRRR